MKSITVRKFLNKKKLDYTSYIYWHVEAPNPNDKYSDAWGEIKIADCSRSINLTLDIYDRGVKQTVEKLQVLIDELIKAKEAVLTAYDIKFKLDKERAKKENNKK